MSARTATIYQRVSNATPLVSNSASPVGFSQASLASVRTPQTALNSRSDTTHLLRQPPGANVEISLSQNPLPAASLTFDGLSFEAKLPDGSTLKILEECSGHFDPGQLVAIMGPSGCGKSTLLDMLSMKKTAEYSGQVLVNGIPRKKSLFPRIAAYVGQEDHMPAYWKVREALQFNAALKVQAYSNGSKKKADDLIESLLESFGLNGVAETYIGGTEVRGISGGQRRRVTLARGVAAQASLLFCDEPTSGLSATDAELCIKALRVIAKRLNVLILVVIHQPRREVATLFDTLLLLTSNPGRMAYFGPMADSLKYFEGCGYPVPSYGNPTDIFLDLLTPGADTDASDKLVGQFQSRQKPGVLNLVEVAKTKRGNTIKEMLQDAHTQALESEKGHASRKVRIGAYTVPFCTQFVVLFRRKLNLLRRSSAAIGMQLLMPIGMGVVLGTVFQGIGKHEFGIGQLMFVFILLTMLSLQSLPLMAMLIEERVYMKLETSEKLYKEEAHILTTMCVTVPVSLFGATLQTLIIYSFAQMEFQFLPLILGWTLLLFFMFDALFQCVAAAAKDGEQAMNMATPFLVVFMLFNGSVVTRSTAPVYLRWVFSISPTMYALQAISIKLAEGGSEMSQGLVKSMGYVKGEDMQGLAIIIGMTVVLRILQCLALKYLNNIQK